MRNSIIIVYMLTLFIFSGCKGNNNPSDESLGEKSRVSLPSDTLYSEKAALNIYGMQPERALQIIDTAEQLGNLTETRADFLRAMVFSRAVEHLRYDTAILIAERLMLNEEVKGLKNIDFYRGMAYGYLVSAYAMLHDNAEALMYVSLFDQTFASQGDSARFQVQEQREIDRQREAVRRAEASRTVIGFIGLFFFLIALVSIGQLRSVEQRNRILAQQITEAVEYKEKYDKLRRSVEANGSDLNSPTHDSQDNGLEEPMEMDPIPTLGPQQLSALSDAELFDYLRDLIEREQLFLNPNFERQTLIGRTGLSKERIGAAFSHASNYERLTTLVRELRLNYAVRLLNEQPELTIEQVCKSSGFANTVSFNRSFKAKYGKTPSSFRGMKA